MVRSLKGKWRRFALALAVAVVAVPVFVAWTATATTDEAAALKRSDWK